MKCDLDDIISFKINEFYSKLNETKEEIIRAFIAKYGLPPDEIELCEQDMDYGKRFWIQRRTPEGSNLYDVK